MKTRTRHRLVFGVLALVSCNEEPKQVAKKAPKAATPAAPALVAIDSAKLGLYAPLPDAIESKTNPLTEEKVSLGRMLFYDARLSKNQDLSCNTCHDLALSGTDGKDFSIGHKKQVLPRNTPSVFNAALAFVQGWDGRVETTEDQAKAHLLDARVMATTTERLTETLKSMPPYFEGFKKAFPDDEDPVTLDTVAKALAAFERKLVTPSRWDALLKGDQAALTDDERKGFLKFVEVGCPTCHVGPLVGGTMYQKLGKEKPWPNEKDKGRSAVTGSPSDDMMWKTPALRNIEKTAPYFHDASGKTLEESVKAMATHQLKKELSDDDARSVTTWLKSLTGTVAPALIQKPTLPESTPKTPKPDPK